MISTEHGFQRLDNVLHRFLLLWLFVIAAIRARRMAFAHVFGKMVSSFEDLTFVVLLAHDTRVSFGTMFELVSRQGIASRVSLAAIPLKASPDFVRFFLRMLLKRMQVIEHLLALRALDRLSPCTSTSFPYR
jgi:hypothetical protein